MNTRGADVALFLYEPRQLPQPRQHKSVEESGDAETQTWIASALPRDDDSDASPGAAQRKIKVSMRSRGLHVGQVAAALGGGGHRMAAGCTMVGAIDDVMRQVLEILERELETEGL